MSLINLIPIKLPISLLEFQLSFSNSVQNNIDHKSKSLAFQDYLHAILASSQCNLKSKQRHQGQAQNN
jgi:hypothetical protein